MCDIAFIPLLMYTQLQFMRVVPPVTGSLICFVWGFFHHIPSKHSTFVQHLYNVGPTSMFCIYWVVIDSAHLSMLGDHFAVRVEHCASVVQFVTFSFRNRTWIHTKIRFVKKQTRNRKQRVIKVLIY